MKKKLFSKYALAAKARTKSRRCLTKVDADHVVAGDFCLACVEAVIQQAFEMGRSGKYI